MIIKNEIESIPRYEEFKYRFRLLTATTYEAVNIITGETIVIDSASDENEVMKEQLELFKRTPEGSLGQKVKLDDLNSLVEKYEWLMIGCIRSRLLKNGKNPDNANVDSMLNWIESTDFFTAPGSSQYHDAHPRGLLLHTMRVYNKMCDLMMLPDFSEVPVDSAALVAISHDWCKIGLYELYDRNVKNESTGRWEKVPSFRRKVETCIASFGHGTSSLFLLTRFFRLTNEEGLAVRWHMGEYNVCDPEMNELHHSNETYPLVQMLQFADRLAITKYYK